MRQAAQPFVSAALSANRFSGGVLGLYDGGQRHDQSGDNDVVGMTIDALERLLFGVECEPKISVLKVFGLGKSTAKNVRHDGRLDKQMLHNFPRTGEVYSSLMRANHCPKSDTSHKLPVCCTESQLVTHNGKCATNAPNTLGIAKAANDLISYPKITIADFDIASGSLDMGSVSSLAAREAEKRCTYPHLSAPSQPKRSDAPGNVFVAPLTLSGATL